MKMISLLIAAALSQVAASSAYAQGAATPDKDPVRAERKKEARAAARSFRPGQGQPIPAARPKVPRAERAAAAQERKTEGAEASKEMKPGEGDPMPAAAAKVPRAERAAARQARRTETARANKAGEIKSKGRIELLKRSSPGASLKKKAAAPYHRRVARRLPATMASPPCNPEREDPHHATITTQDGTQLYYKDWGKGQPIVFSHGWPLTADDWDNQMLFFLAQGFRVIAHDRRGHGRSTQTWSGNEMDTYADDLAALTAALDLKDAVHVGHSTGGGEVARYLGRHGTKRVAKAVLIGAVPPIMLKTEANPGGLPIEVFDGIRAGVAGDRSQFYLDLTMPFYGYNRAGAKISEGIRQHWWLQEHAI